MHRFRMFLAWLLLAALPLQGFAAASMLHCAPASQTAAHEHHGEAAGHSHEGAAHDPAAQPGDTHASASAQPDTGHKCSACASCCQAVVVATLPQVPVVSPAPVAPAEPPPVTVASRILSVPDKPPRA